MKPLALATFVVFSIRAQTSDHYPQVRDLVLEAEAASANLSLLKDRSNPHTWAGDILAHAGYLEDAERAYAKSPSPSMDPPYILWRAWVVYGHPERAEKLIESATSPEKKATHLASFADLLWRAGKPQQARERFEAARAIAVKIVDLAKRKQVLVTIDQGLQYVSDPPPDLLSATPHPRPPFNIQNSPIPAFPITTDGFMDVDPKEKGARTSADGELMKQLYDRAAAGDLASIERITASATTPFQKALGTASLEHVFIQLRQPEQAEQYAKQISEADSSSSLAKAEALSAAGSAWLRAVNDDRARADFSLAKSIVALVPDLLLGKISVLVSIGAEQFKARMIEDSDTTFRSAIELAQKLPMRPVIPSGARRPQIPLGVNYKDEAFVKIVRAAIHVRNVEIANDASTAWRSAGDNVDSALVDAWLADGLTNEAIAVARRIEDPESRVSELLSLARNLLNEAGAPIF